MSRQLAKAIPDFKMLDKFSTTVAKRINQLRPMWMTHARVKTFLKQFYLRFDFEAPDHSVGCDVDLFLATYGQKLTVGFDHYHTHMDNYRGQQTFEERLSGALWWIDGVMNEEIFVRIQTEGDQYKLGWFGLMDKMDEYDLSDVTYIRSWRGTYSRMIGQEE